MAVAATSAAPAPSGQSAPVSGGAGTNPFQLVTNLYAEKNVQGLQTGLQLSNGTIPTGGAVNAGQYLRAVRLIVRTVTAGEGGTPTADGTAALFSTLSLTNVDGSEILYAMNSYSHWLIQTYGRPWEANMVSQYDYTADGNSPSGTFLLQPEVRWTACCLANTDTRSQYRYDAVLGAVSNIATGSETPPTISIQPVMEAYAQPDDSDLQGTPNQAVPPGINLQTKRRHQVFNMNAAGNNTFLSTLTGNALRLQVLVTRNTAGQRIDGLSDPLYWQIDNRSLGKLNPDLVWQWANDFYTPWAANVSTNATQSANAHGVSDTGIYLFPRYLDPGNVKGDGWMYTANNTKLQWESATANGGSQLELITDEVYPVGEVDPSLMDI